MTKLVPRQPEHSLAVQMGRLRAPVEVIHLPDHSIYYLTKSGHKHGRRTNPEDCAMLVAKRTGFNLHFYPKAPDDQVPTQVVMDLPVERLAEAVDALIGAGFGVQFLAPPKEQVVPAALLACEVPRLQA